MVPSLSAACSTSVRIASRSLYSQRSLKAAATSAKSFTNSSPVVPPAPSNERLSIDPLPEADSIAPSEAVDPSASHLDWAKSFHGLSSIPFPKQAADTLLAPIDPADVEIKPDGILYLPEIKYRRVLNKAFGPGGWGLAPRSETRIESKQVNREYALICLGRLVGIARGEQTFFDPSGVATATEGCKSNALMRCCKDLGIASELWDPRFVRDFKTKYCLAVFCTNSSSPTQKKRMWRRKDDPPFGFPWKET